MKEQEIGEATAALVEELGLGKVDKVLYNDNAAALALSQGTSSSWRTRQLRIRTGCASQSRMEDSASKRSTSVGGWIDKTTSRSSTCSVYRQLGFESETAYTKRTMALLGIEITPENEDNNGIVQAQHGEQTVGSTTGGKGAGKQKGLMKYQMRCLEKEPKQRNHGTQKTTIPRQKKTADQDSGKKRS